jgi:hypothetical protein
MPAAAGHLPNAIVIGAQKCGTTSLHYYLGRHPQVRMSREKELDFFVAEGNWPRGIEWYKSNFQGTAKVYGESSPSYTNFPIYRQASERMAAVAPNARLIYLVRDPVERMVSHYMHEVSEGAEPRPVEAAFETLEDNAYVTRSRYFMQLEQYLGRFPDSHILVVAAEDLRDHRRQALQHIFRFLEVDDQFTSTEFSRYLHSSTYQRRPTRIGRLLQRAIGARLEPALPPEIRWYVMWSLYYPFSRPVERPTLPAELRGRLSAALKDDVERLRAYTGQAFAGWSV